MNPEENDVAAARAIIAAKKQYPDLGLAEMDSIARSFQSAAPQALTLIAKLREDKGNAVATGLQGFTGNFADEIVGHMPEALGGGKAEGDKLKLRDEIFHADHHVIAPLVELAGGIGSAAVTGGAGKGLEAVGVGAKAAKAALAGGVWGGISGAGRGETASERLTGAGEGALVGMALGGALGTVGGRSASALERNTKLVNESASAAKVTEASAALREQGQKMLDHVNKQYAHDPVMRDVATAGVKKMYPDLGDEAAPVVTEAAKKAAAKASEPLGVKLLDAVPHFLFGTHSGIAKAGHIVFKHATGADAVVSKPGPISTALGKADPTHLGQGAALLVNLIRSLHRD